LSPQYHLHRFPEALSYQSQSTRKLESGKNAIPSSKEVSKKS
jgi:hypothetical protein